MDLFNKDKKYKVGVINLMGNVFMRKTEMFLRLQKLLKIKLILKKECRLYYCRFSW